MMRFDIFCALAVGEVIWFTTIFAMVSASTTRFRPKYNECAFWLGESHPGYMLAACLHEGAKVAGNCIQLPPIQTGSRIPNAQNMYLEGDRGTQVRPSNVMFCTKDVGITAASVSNYRGTL